MNHDLRLRFTRDFAAVHWAVLVLIQIVNFLGYLLPENGRVEAVLQFLVTLPFLQAENLLTAGLVGVLGYLLAR